MHGRMIIRPYPRPPLADPWRTAGVPARQAVSRKTATVPRLCRGENQERLSLCRVPAERRATRVSL